MFERFTDRARMVVVKAQDESRLLNHVYIDTEHLLLGMLAEADGIAGKALTDVGLTLESVRDAVNKVVGRGDSPPVGNIPFTINAKRALDEALRQALRLDHSYIGTEHLLLGLLAIDDTKVDEVLQSLNIDAARLRQRVLIRLSANSILTRSDYPRSLENIEFDLALTQARLIALQNELANAQARFSAQSQQG
jgi:ATP-dependent Clp protease ATP-binding subunit ClpC